MGGTVFLPCWLFGLKCPSIGAYRLLSRARSRWENGDLQEGSCQWVLPRSTATSAFVLTVSYSHQPPPPVSIGYPQTLAEKSGPVFYEVTDFFSWVLVHTRPCVCPLRVEFLFPLVLWNSYGQTLVAFKDRFSQGSSSHCQTQNFHSIWELLWHNYFSDCRSLIQYRMWFDHNLTFPTNLLWLLLRFCMQDIFFGRSPCFLSMFFQ